MSESRTRLHRRHHLVRSSRHVFQRRRLRTTLYDNILADRSLNMMLWTTESSFAMGSNSRATTLPPPTLSCCPTGTQMAGVNDSGGENRRSRKVRRMSSRHSEADADSAFGGPGDTTGCVWGNIWLAVAKIRLGKSGFPRSFGLTRRRNSLNIPADQHESAIAETFCKILDI